MDAVSAPIWKLKSYLLVDTPFRSKLATDLNCQIIDVLHRMFKSNEWMFSENIGPMAHKHTNNSYSMSVAHKSEAKST